ncbi:RICIN domain-containing protein [Streptomyces sp. H28]|uniref:RICIN domain-containing protein n=1 Tax=Streptomyces sp. H28 TaxID=2775865 RepID=UPI0017872585|nr:RICIN domain-containing protein [Streptomyces sp. H28]MBD9730665.1 RICIN domain-containing protein [Streptomyces sp. H28]
MTENPTTESRNETTPQGILGLTIPTGRAVWIDHMVTSLHLNSAGWHGGPGGHTMLFHDRNTIDTEGEKWKFAANGDGTYTITNAESGHELIVADDKPYKRVVLSGRGESGGQKWRLQRSGLFDSFSLHPADDLSVAVAPLNNTNLHLYLLPFQPYLTQFFTVTDRNV